MTNYSVTAIAVTAIASDCNVESYIDCWRYGSETYEKSFMVSLMYLPSMKLFIIDLLPTSVQVSCQRYHSQILIMISCRASVPHTSVPFWICSQGAREFISKVYKF